MGAKETKILKSKEFLEREFTGPDRTPGLKLRCETVNTKSLYSVHRWVQFWFVHT